MTDAVSPAAEEPLPEVYTPTGATFWFWLVVLGGRKRVVVGYCRVMEEKDSVVVWMDRPTPACPAYLHAW